MTRVYIGTYTEDILFGTGKILQGKGEGIYHLQVDLQTGAMEQVGLTAGVPNPSFLALHPSGRYLYAVNELKEFEDAVSGAASAFSVDSDGASLTFINNKATHGTDPCHLAVHPSGRYLLVANFASGSVCVLPISKDGSLGDATHVVQHQGSSVDPVRQAGPHAHAVNLDPSGRYLFVPDLGLDQLLVYQLDLDRGLLQPADPSTLTLHPGAGPRQLALHPGGRYAYLINELDSTITALRCDMDAALLHKIQTVSTLPDGFKGASTCAELQVAPSGDFVYASNRGHDSLAIFAVDRTAGTLSLVGHQKTGGRTPRHFTLSPGGELLLVANQDTDNLVSFKPDPTSGQPHPTGHTLPIPTPVCVTFT
jgi:6-phosphogluconolactonase